VAPPPVRDELDSISNANASKCNVPVALEYAKETGGRSALSPSLRAPRTHLYSSFLSDFTTNFIRNSSDSPSGLCARSANAYMGTCGTGTDGTPPIISNVNPFRRTLCMIPATLERGWPDRTFNGGFVPEVSVNVWKHIS